MVMVTIQLDQTSFHEYYSRLNRMSRDSINMNRQWRTWGKFTCAAAIPKSNVIKFYWACVSRVTHTHKSTKTEQHVTVSCTVIHCSELKFCVRRVVDWVRRLHDEKQAMRVWRWGRRAGEQCSHFCSVYGINRSFTSIQGRERIEILLFVELLSQTILFRLKLGRSSNSCKCGNHLLTE